MKVVLSGYYGFNNVGDEAILYSIIRALRTIEPDIKITVLSNDPASTEETYGVSAVNRWRMGAVMAAVATADGLISGGGSLLQDKTGFRSVSYYTGIMLMAKMAGTPFFVYAQGIGPINRGMNKKLAKFALSKAKGITVRDEESLQFLQSIGVKKEIKKVPDPVLGIPLIGYSNQWLEEQKFEKPVISISVRDWDTKADYKKKLAEALDRAAAAGNEIVFVPMHGVFDHVTSEEIVRQMTQNAHIAPYDMSIEEKILLIGQTDVLVGMRLHALIFAAVVGTPFLALSYDPKIDSFASQANQPVVGHVDEDNWTAEQLAEQVLVHLENRDDEIDKMKNFVDEAKREAQETARLALQSFKR